MRATGEMFAREAERLPALSIPYVQGGDTLSGMDCQGLMEYCLRRLGIRKNWRGSNAMWRDMVWRGSPEECRSAFGRIPLGAFLYILKDDGGERARGYQDGLGNASHVGVYTGSGKGAVHASASRGCVAESAFSGKTVHNGGWNRVGLCAELDYGLDMKKGVSALKMTVFSENGGRVRLRAAPGLEAQCLERLEPGEEVEMLGETGDWAIVSWKGEKGFMMRRFLTESMPVSSGDTESLEERIRSLEERVKKLEEG